MNTVLQKLFHSVSAFQRAAQATLPESLHTLILGERTVQNASHTSMRQGSMHADIREQPLQTNRKGDINMEHNPTVSQHSLSHQSQTPLVLGPQPDGSYVLECRWCQKIEVLSPAEVQWYLDRGFAMPSRCAHCRRKRRGIHRNYAARQESI